MNSLNTATVDVALPRGVTPMHGPQPNYYAELKQMLRQKGLLDRQPGYYVIKLILTMGMFIVSLLFLLVLNNSWLQLLNAVFLAFIWGQLSFVVHDAGHRQLFASQWKNDLVGLICANLLLGSSFNGWVSKHNQHHGKPNQLELDPDITSACIAYTVEQAQRKNFIERPIVKYQAYLFFPLLFLEPLALRAVSIQFLFKEQAKHRSLEILLIVIHYALYLGGLFYLLDIWLAVLFIIISLALYGLYMGSVFITNHTGMPILDNDVRMDFVQQQTLTARNVNAHPVTDFCYGALNYQIEHHLFPSMARNKMKEAQQVVRDFCHARSIPYHACGVIQSYREVLRFFHKVSAPLREEKNSLLSPTLPIAKEKAR